MPWQWVWIMVPLSVGLSIVVGLLACRCSTSRPRAVRILVAATILLATIAVGSILLLHPTTDPLDVRHLIAAVGLALALYMQLYWVYSAWQSGLYQDKAGRRWPEGKEKRALGLPFQRWTP
jgi:hypothetical protein